VEYLEAAKDFLEETCINADEVLPISGFYEKTNLGSHYS
jgi:hypothetical protein